MDDDDTSPSGGFTFLSRLSRLRDEFVKNMHDSAVNNNITAAAGGSHSDLYQLMQMLVEANSISQQLNKHTVRHLLLLT